MPIVHAERLTRIGTALLKAAGASDEEASAVAVGCVNANLAGHDSHGIIRVEQYATRVRDGGIVPGAPTTVGNRDGTGWAAGNDERGDRRASRPPPDCSS